MNYRKLLLGATALVACSVSAKAATYTWGGSSNGNWNAAVWHDGTTGGQSWQDGNDAVFSGTTGYEITVNANYTPTNITFNGTGNWKLIDGGNNLGSAGVLTKNGTGMLTLLKNNVFSGAIAVNAGVVMLNGAGGGGGGFWANSFTLNGGRLVTSEGSTVSGEIVIGAAGASFGTKYQDHKSLILAGSISGSGAMTIERETDGANDNSWTGGRVILTAANAGYTGAITISGAKSYSQLQVGNGGTTGSLGGATSVTVNKGSQNSNALIFKRSNTYTVTGGGSATLDGSNTNATVAGDGRIRQEGTGKLIMAGTNTYSGGTDIVSGSIEAQTTTALGSGPVDISTDALLKFNCGAGDSTFANKITGAGKVETAVDKTGRLIISGANTYSGGTDITAGTLRATTATALGTGNISINNAILELFGSINNATVPTVTWANDISINNGKLFGVAGSNGIAAGKTITITNTATFGTAYQANQNLWLSAKITGTGNVVIDQWQQSYKGGWVVFGANNDYTGTTTINDGGNNSRGGDADIKNQMRLQIGNGGTTGSFGAGDVIVNGELRFKRSNTYVVENNISGKAYDSAQDTGGGGYINVATGTVVFAGNNTYKGVTDISTGATLQIGNEGTKGSLGDGTGSVVNNGTLKFNRSDAHTVNNAISGTGTVVKEGADKIIMTGANTYSGGTNITAGTIEAVKITALGTGKVSISGGAALELRTDDMSKKWVNEIAIDNGKLFSLEAPSLGESDPGRNIIQGNTVTGKITIGAGGATFGSNWQQWKSLILAGDISGTGNMKIERGTDVADWYGGRVVLTAANAGYTGEITISGAQSWSYLQVGNGGTTGDGTIGSLGGATSVTVEKGSQNSNALIFKRSDTYTVTGGGSATLDGSNTNATVAGDGRVRQEGSGKLIMAGTNTYSGGTDIVSGSIEAQTTTALGSGAVDISTGASLKFNCADGGPFNNVIKGTGAVEIIGGMITLAGANTYTGLTTISGGTLALGATGSLRSAVNAETGTTFSLGTAGSVTGNVTMATGSTLTGVGTVNGNLAANGATINIGNSPGTIAVTGNADLTNARIKVEYAADGVDVLDVSGEITLGGTILEFTETSGLIGKIDYNVFGTNNSLSASDLIGKVAIEGLDDSRFDWAWKDGASGAYLEVQAIPEPSTYALLGGIAAAGIAFVARRRRRG